MGVNACDRAGCQSILCHRILTTQDHEYYICSDCERELREKAENWPVELSKGDLSRLIDAFMATTPEDSETVTLSKELDKMFRE